MDAQKEAYRSEAYELLAELEMALLELEAAPADGDLVDRVFRALHTIKGSGAMFGFDAVAEFTHDVETVFDQVRTGSVAVNAELVNLALRARDHIKKLLDQADREGVVDPESAAEILAGFRAIRQNACAVEEHDHPKTAAGPEKASESAAAAVETIYRIRFAPHSDLFMSGTNPLALLSELAGLGRSRIVLHSDRLPPPAEFDPEGCYLYWDIVLSAAVDINAVKDVFIFVEDRCDLGIEVIDAQGDFREIDEAVARPLGQILVERGDLQPAELEAALRRQKRIGEILVESRAVSPQKVRSALAEQETVRGEHARRAQISAASSVRVAADKLDKLVNLVGELVTVQARLSRKAAMDRDPELQGISEVVERLTAELRDNTMSIRMLPIDTTFNKLRRLVRDLSRDLAKNIALTAEGGDTELDKTVIEQLGDPLVHILRNCIDHGIEPPEQRRAAGKPEQGVVSLKAGHTGASVVIEIGDDGAGIDPQRVRRKAVEKGLLSPDAERSDAELLQLIFLPGFSTAEAVTSVSGRGVGMDVVKRAIDNLRGSIEVNSRVGAGTTITLKLPLTLAIIDGLLVEIGTDKYVLPLSAIEECVELTREARARTHGRNMLNIRGGIVPFVPLREHFGISGEAPDIEQVVINSVAGQRVGIVVDRVVGEHQIVIKTMNSLYKNVDEVSGATILGDGSVALILDVQRLLLSLQPAELAA